MDHEKKIVNYFPRVHWKSCFFFISLFFFFTLKNKKVHCTDLKEDGSLEV